MSGFDIDKYDVRNPAEFQWMVRVAQKRLGYTYEEFAEKLLGWDGAGDDLLQWKRDRAPLCMRGRAVLKNRIRGLVEAEGLLSS